MKWPCDELKIVHWPSPPYEHRAGMRLDVGLVHRLGGVTALDDDFGLLETFLDIALVEVNPLGDV